MPAPPLHERTQPPLSRARSVALALALVVVTLMAYLPAWRGAPLWDDDQHITRPELRGLDGLRRIWTELGATQQYYPVTHSVFWLEQRLWGRSPLGYHLLNVLLHAASALVLWAMLRQLDVPWAPLAAALFALHPINVESVAWISELKNTLSGFLCLASAWCFLRYQQTRSIASCAAALGLFLLALGAKSAVAPLPAALLLVIWWKRGRLTWREPRRLLPLLPMLGAGVAAGLFTAWVERKLIGAEGAPYQLSGIARTMLAARAFWFYLGKLLCPMHLSFIYPRWPVDSFSGRGPSSWPSYLSLVALATLTASLWALRRASRAPLVAAGAFAVMLFPALGFFNIYPFVYSFVANHFQYLAGPAAFALAAGGTAWFVGGNGRGRRLLRRITLCAWALVLLLFAGLTAAQARNYRDPLALWDATIEQNPGCWMAFENRGILRQQQGQPRLARQDFEQALRLNPQHARACNNLAVLSNQDGDYATALAYCNRSLALAPDVAEAHYNRGNAYFGLKDYSRAVSDYTRAIALQPRLLMARNNRGNAYCALHQYPQALADYDDVLTLNPAFGEAYHNRGVAHLALQQYDQAWADVKACRRLNVAVNPGFLRLLTDASGRSE
jgi:tetratricopeptide (TPR) repeat protein